MDPWSCYLSLGYHEVQGSTLHSLRSLNLAGNSLHGAVPPDIAYLDQLMFLALHNNQLTSYLPEDIGKLSNLEWLSIEFVFVDSFEKRDWPLRVRLHCKSD